MHALFVRLLRNADGFTAIEYGLMAALGLIIFGQLFANNL